MHTIPNSINFSIVARVQRLKKLQVELLSDSERTPTHVKCSGTERRPTGIGNLLPTTLHTRPSWANCHRSWWLRCASLTEHETVAFPSCWAELSERPLFGSCPISLTATERRMGKIVDRGFSAVLFLQEHDMERPSNYPPLFFCAFSFWVTEALTLPLLRDACPVTPSRSPSLLSCERERDFRACSFCSCASHNHRVDTDHISQHGHLLPAPDFSSTVTATTPLSMHGQ